MYKSIVISGPVASGSTTAAKLLSQELEIPYKSAGDFFREYMLSRNIPLPQKEKIPDDVEKKVDEELTQLASSKSIIIDGLYTGYFARSNPQVLKVLLTSSAVSLCVPIRIKKQQRTLKGGTRPMMSNSASSTPTKIFLTPNF